MPRVTTAALLAAAALAAAGCGGGEPDKEKIESAVRDYYTAFADADGDKACDQLAAQTKDDFLKASHEKDCTVAIEKATKRADVKRFTERLRSAKVVSVDVNGEAATAKVRALGTTTSVPLHKEGDDWKIQAQIGAGAGGD